MANVRINLTTEAILAGIGSAIASIIVGVWVLLQVFVVDPIHELQIEIKDFRLMYIEEVTSLKSKVASLELDAQRLHEELDRKYRTHSN